MERDMEEHKLSYAGGGGDTVAEREITEEDMKLLDAFHQLHVKPDIESVEDLKRFMRKYGQIKKEKDEIDSPSMHHEPMHKSEPTSHGSYQYPRLATFFGEGTKGDVNWESFKFEVRAIQSMGTFTEAQILFGLRRAVRGEASDIVRRLGTSATLQIMMKLESTYGHIDSKETVLKKFYSCAQQAKESVTAFASRLEELFAQACDLGAMRRTENEILKQVLYQGLRKDLKQMSIYQCHTISDYDRFKIELRKVEADMESEEARKPCKPVVSQEKEEKTEMGEVKSLLMQLNERIKKLEDERSDVKLQNQQSRGYFGWRKLARGRFRPIGQGRGDYRPNRPTGTNTFQPTCYLCSGKGHLARECPQLSGRKCFNCKKPGHKSRECPN